MLVSIGKHVLCFFYIFAVNKIISQADCDSDWVCKERLQRQKWDLSNAALWQFEEIYSDCFNNEMLKLRVMSCSGVALIRTIDNFPDCWARKICRLCRPLFRPAAKNIIPEKIFINDRNKIVFLINYSKTFEIIVKPKLSTLILIVLRLRVKDRYNDCCRYVAATPT